MLGISRFIVFIFVMCTFCLVFCRDASAEVLTLEAYEKYLTEQGIVNSEALKAKGQLIKFSPEKKQKFMKYSNDPEVVTSVFKENGKAISRADLDGKQYKLLNDLLENCTKEEVKKIIEAAKEKMTQTA